MTQKTLGSIYTDVVEGRPVYLATAKKDLVEAIEKQFSSWGFPLDVQHLDKGKTYRGANIKLKTDE